MNYKLNGNKINIIINISNKSMGLILSIILYFFKYFLYSCWIYIKKLGFYGYFNIIEIELL